MVVLSSSSVYCRKGGDGKDYWHVEMDVQKRVQEEGEPEEGMGMGVDEHETQALYSVSSVIHMESMLDFRC